MLVSTLPLALASSAFWSLASTNANAPFNQDSLQYSAGYAIPAAMSPPQNIAIIGAGAAGTSAAYHLRRYAFAAGVSLNITIFEKNDYIGGRSTTVNAYDLKSEPVELGASIFVSVNTILTNATHDFGLPLIDAGDRAPPGYNGPELAIWDGESFVFTQKSGDGWWEKMKLLWRYGRAPFIATAEMKKSVGRFLGMYDDSWPDLSDEVERLGLLEYTGTTGRQLLKMKGVQDRFANELVQASTRVNYANNLGVVSGMISMVCLATDGAVSVEGGNWRIFDKFAKSATQDIRLNTTVLDVSKGSEGTYLLKTTWPGAETETTYGGFNHVIVAGPWQFSKLNIPSLSSAPDEIPYVELHVTLFTSPHKLSHSFFNLSAEEPVPLTVLTTLPPDDDGGSKPTYDGKPGFFSISTLRPIINPITGQPEFLYKVFSPRAMTPSFLASALGIEAVPDSLDAFAKEDVSWLYQKLWNSYPVELPRVTYDRTKLEEGLWYTGAMDSFISTMETNALMGRNVARLIAKEWQETEKQGRDTAVGGAVALEARLYSGQKPLRAKL